MLRRVKKKIGKLWAAIALLSVEVFVIVGMFTIALFGFAYMVKRVFVLQNTGFDQSAFRFLSRFVSERNNDIMLLITYLGTHYFLIPANLILIIYFLVIKPHKWYSIKVPAIAISSVLLMFLLKFLFSRPRPLPPLLDAARGMSFPSGHALNSVTFYGLVAYMIWNTKVSKRSKIIMIACLMLLVLLIGISRIYLRVHYASDVIAGYCMGALWLIMCILILRNIEQFSKKEVNAVVADN